MWDVSSDVEDSRSIEYGVLMGGKEVVLWSKCREIRLRREAGEGEGRERKAREDMDIDFCEAEG